MRRHPQLALLATAALAIAGCGSGEERRPAARLPLSQQPADATTADRAGGAGEDDSATPLAESPRPATGPSRQGTGAVQAQPPGRITVQVTRPLHLHASPGGPTIGTIEPRTEFHSATVLPVIRRSGPWLGVVSKRLANNRVGWISVNAALVAYRTRWSVVVSLSHREVVVRRGGRIMLRFPVAVGSPSTPTPTGRFAVTDKLLTDDPGSPYGCCILALSAHQPRTPQGWGGGDRVAIHATNLPETIGTAASLGCLRGPADEIRRAVHAIPLGTVVTIRA